MNFSALVNSFIFLTVSTLAIGLLACSDATPVPTAPTSTVEVNTTVPGGTITATARASSTRPTATSIPTVGVIQTPVPTPTASRITPTPTLIQEPKDEQEPRIIQNESSSGTSITDRQALVALFEATDGPDWDRSEHWDRRENWLTDADIGLWNGVTTNAQGRVIKLQLAGIFMDGPIPAILGSLTQLEALDLSRNYISGTIPAELGNLANLRELDLSGNDLRGGIPSELGRLSKLEKLDLNGNKLQGGVPPELGNLTDLELLQIDSNALTGPVPPELGNLSKLRVLNLSWNELSGSIPPELGNLTQLEDMRLFQNYLTGPIPASLGNLVNLEHLDFDSNDLSGEIPPELGSLGDIQVLSIKSNQLTGQLPPELSGLKRVEELLIDGNNLSGEIPPEMGNLFRVREIGLWGNSFGGCIPWTLSIHYYLEEDLGLPFCDPPQILHGDTASTSDYLGPSMQYLGPVLWSALYSRQTAAGSDGSLRIGIGHYPESEDSYESPILDEYIRSGGGVFVGEEWDYIWAIPMTFIPKVICRPEVYLAVLVEEDGTSSSDHLDKAYENIDDVLNHVIFAYRSGVSGEEAVLYAFVVRGDKIATFINTETVSLADEIRAWLDSRNIYTIPPGHYYQEHPSVSALLTVSQIESLAEQFQDAWISAEDFDGQGLPMLRSQWPAPTLAYERFLSIAFLDPDNDPEPLIPGQGLRPCSS